MSDERHNFLGVDWGERKIGLALAHYETWIAIALPEEVNDDALLGRMSKLIAEEGIGTVIIGLPLRRTAGERKHPATAWALSLAAKTGAAIEYADEMFTSALAQRALRERGEKKVSTHDDSEAAKILLQDWLEHHRRALS